jgi:hypothetical protein
VNLSLSPQIRLVALVGALAAALMLAGFFFMTRSQADASAEPMLVPAHAEPAPTAAKRVVKTAEPKPVAKRATSAQPAAKAVGRAVRKPAAAKPAVAANGLPMAIVDALRKHRVVVVSLFVPRARVDEMALREASAGATAAGAGFVALNVLHEAKARPLATKLGVVETPALVVYRRPGDVFVQLDGFVDHDTVSQAVANAAQ